MQAIELSAQADIPILVTHLDHCAGDSSGI